ncbi:MAG: pyrroline-5-carboxylate reductase, partial [Thermoplasmatota archaeon]
MAKRLAVIGCGNMGAAIVRGLLKEKWTTASHLMASHPHRAALLTKELGIRVVASNRKAAEDASVILLAVKPQILPEVLEELAGYVDAGALVLSMAAGVGTQRIEEALPGIAVVRSMPNLAATVGMGATAIAPGAHADFEHIHLARSVFEAVGTVEEVPERLMDAVTGLSGTGPMYVFHLVEAMADAGVKVGLSRDVASRLASQTVLGSARLAQQSDLHPAALKDQVTSPAGTASRPRTPAPRPARSCCVPDAPQKAGRPPGRHNWRWMTRGTL